MVGKRNANWNTLGYRAPLLPSWLGPRLGLRRTIGIAPLVSILAARLRKPRITPRWRSWLALALLVCLLGGLWRALPLLVQTPLIALANSYDETRYSACFDLYPDRPADIPPTQNSPQAPFSRYAFRANDQPMCYWSSELLFQGAVVVLYRAQAALTGQHSFSVRWLGSLKFAVLLGLWVAFSLAWWRRGEAWPALANGLLLPLLFVDPANTIYLNTFYAEWTALLALYTLCSLILLYANAANSRRASWLLAAAAFVLALSKIQHLLLPCVFALIVLGAGYWRNPRHWPWQGKALLLGALAGLSVQVVQLQRDSPAIRAIDMFNRADVTFTGLLPNARDPAATASALGIAPDCLRFIGLRAWQMSDYPEHACAGLVNVTRGRELATLLHEPGLGWRLFWHGALALDPWLAPGLGLVEGGNFHKMPNGYFSLSDALTAAPPLRALVLGGPPLALILLLLSGPQRRPRLLIYTALTVATMLATLGITVLGDGLADTPKQGHLIVNAALAWWICILVLAVGRLATCRRSPAAI